MLLDTHKISLIYDFWKFNNEENYLHDVNELSRKLIESDTSDAQYIQRWIPDLLRLVQYWEDQSLMDLDEFYAKLLANDSSSDQIDALLRFLYDIQSYELVKYLLEKNVQRYKKEKFVSKTMSGFHEACMYGFSQVCSLYINNGQDVNESFSLIYVNCKTNEKEIIRNLTGLQLVCLWSMYFPKRLLSYAHTLRLLLNHGARPNMTSTELTTALHWTCRAKHTTQLAQDLIAAGAYVQARDRINIQPIHYACWSRNRTLIDLLLEKGVRLTDPDDFGRTPLHFLCMPTYIEIICANDQQEQYELIQYLHKSQKKIDFTQQDHHNHTLLAYACVSHNCSLMEFLLQQQPNLLNQTTKDGQTPLMIAIEESFLEGVKYLLEQPSLSRTACDRAGNTAIHHICMHCETPVRLELLQLLLNDPNGRFDLEKRNAEGHDPLMLSVINQSIQFCSLLIQHNVSVTKTDLHGRQPLHLACQLGNDAIVSMLLKSSQININAVDYNSRNCLFYGISSENNRLVDFLIENHVEILIRDTIGDTPLHAAVQHPTKAKELTESLFKTQQGKQLINLAAADGVYPILLAATFRQAEVIHTLIKNGADLSVVDSERHTALHLACRSGCMKCVFYLIEFGHLDVNAIDCYRQTPIFYAYGNNDHELVQYLILAGAKLDLRDSENYLPLHIGILVYQNDDVDYDVQLVECYKTQHESLIDDNQNECQITPLIAAVIQGHLRLVQHLILNCKVNIMAKCSNGHTALHYACLHRHRRSSEIIEFLIEHGCTYEQIDQPKGSFLFTIIQYGDRQAMKFFVDQWLKSQPDINELHYGATLLDLLYDRAHFQHHDLDVVQVRHLIENGAQFYSSDCLQFPCPLINDCPQFYLILLEYNCSLLVNPTAFIYCLLHSISICSEPYLLINRSNLEWISICDYFFEVIRLIHYYYSIDRFYSTIRKEFLPHLHAEQQSEEVHRLETELDRFQRTPLKLIEITRKRLRQLVSRPTAKQFEQLGLTVDLRDFLVQTKFFS